MFILREYAPESSPTSFSYGGGVASGSFFIISSKLAAFSFRFEDVSFFLIFFSLNHLLCGKITGFYQRSYGVLF